MARRTIKITPGTEAWHAWLGYYRRTGNKAELVMLRCAQRDVPFEVHSEFPPDAPRAEGAPRKAAASEVTLPPRRVVHDGEVEQIAERVGQAMERDAETTKALTLAGRKKRKAAKAHNAALESVQKGKAPSLEGLNDLGTREAFDPYEMQEVLDGKRSPEKLKPSVKIVNLRDDPIGQMAKRKQIEPLHLEAARRYQAIHDTAQIGGARGIDPTNMKVDGGRIGEPVSDVQRASIKRMHQIDVRLGDVGAMLVRRVLGDRMTIAQVAAIMGVQGARGALHVGWRVRECLDTLIDVMGLVVEGRARRTPRDAAARNAEHADRPGLHAAVRRAQLGR